METRNLGWLLMQVGLLKRWKRKWFCLSHDGSLTISSRPYAQPDEMVDLPVECKEIRFGEACGKIKLPKDHPNYLICIELKSPPTLVILASNQEEFTDWKNSLKFALRSQDFWSLRKGCDQKESNDTDSTRDKNHDEGRQSLPSLTARQQVESMYCNKRSTQIAWPEQDTTLS